MIFTSQLGTKPSYLTPPLAPLTPLSHTKAKSPRPNGGPEKGGGEETGTIQWDREREKVRDGEQRGSIRTVRQGKEETVCKSNGAGSVDGGGVESKRVREGGE